MRVISKLLSACVLFAAFFTTVNTWSGEAQPLAADPELEKRVEAVSSELRCLVCQNQTIADSHAELAIDLKNQVREMLRSGKSNDDVVNYMVDRYGDFVRYKPPMKPTTYFLWFGPGILIIVGLFVLMVTLRKRKARIDESPQMSQDDLKKVDELLHSSPGDSKS